MTAIVAGTPTLTGGMDNLPAAGRDAKATQGTPMDIHRADPAYRSRTLLLVALTVLACTVFLLLLHAWLQRVTAQLMSSDPDTMRRWLRALFTSLGLLLAAPALLIGANLRRLGIQSNLEQRFPPEEWKTLRDVRILRHEHAVRWAKRTRMLGAAALALGACLVVWSLWALWRYA